MKVYSSEGREDEYASEMEGLIEHGLLDLRLNLKLADYFARKNQPDRAAAFYEEAIRIDPFQMAIHVVLARQLIDSSRPLQALKELDIALEIRPEMETQMHGMGLRYGGGEDKTILADIRAQRGEIYLQMGDLKTAAEEVKKALALQPNHPRATELKKKLSPQKQGEQLNEKGKHQMRLF
jgi:tetratricopeptide (TPR) repeat protein